MRLFLTFFLFLFVISINAQRGRRPIDNIQLKQLAWGKVVQKDDLKNRVVVFNAWAVNDSRSRSFQSQVKRFYKKYKKYGLKMVGIHATQIPIEDVYKYCKKINYPFSMYYAAIRGSDFEIGEAPYMLVFDIQGNLAFRGHPSKGFREIIKLLKYGTHWLLGDKKFKHLKKEEIYFKKVLRKGYGMRKLLKRLDKKRKDENAEVVKEVDEMLGFVTQLKIQEKKRLAKIKQFYPADLYKEYKDLIKLFRGTQYTKDLQKEYKVIRQDKVFKKTLQAYKIWQAIKDLRFSFRPGRYGEGVNLKDPKCLKKNYRALTKIMYYNALLQKKYPETIYAKIAKKASERWGSYLKRK